MSLLRSARAGAVLATGLLASALAPVAMTGPAGAATTTPSPARAASATTTPIYLAAGLRGFNEVGEKGDDDGGAFVVVKIHNDQVTFAMRWNDIDLPSGAHIHLGESGVNGDVKVPFFAEGLPGTSLGVLGTAKADPEVLSALVRDPSGFYANIHNAKHPKGALRGQFYRVAEVDLVGVLHGGNKARYSSSADGAQEVQGNDGMKRGDADGRAVWYMSPQGSKMGFTAVWEGLGKVVGGHIHRAPRNQNGPVVIDFIGAPQGLPENIFGLSGEAAASTDVIKRIKRNPSNWYTNLHTTEFNGGAVRGVLSNESFRHPRAFMARVVRGQQVYACARVRGVGFRYVQHSSTARLGGGLVLSSGAGRTPKFVASDGSAVRARILHRTSNDRRSLENLVLEAESIGRRDGLLSQTTQILRINTERGVAPSGRCRPGTRAIAPFKADYLFVS